MSRNLGLQFVLSVVGGAAVSGALSSINDRVGQVGRTVTSALGGLDNRMQALGSRADHARQRLEQLNRSAAGITAGTTAHQRMTAEIEHQQRAVDQLARRYERLHAVRIDRDAARQNFQEKRGDLVTAGAIGAGLAVPAVIGAKYEDSVKQLAITGELYKEAGAEAALSQSIRDAAVRRGVAHEQALAGVEKLVAQGMDPKIAGAYADTLARTHKATRADIGDLAELVFTLQTKFKLQTDEEIFAALNVLTKAGKLGQYEIKSMSKAFPELGGAAASFGSTGMAGVAEMGAMMQVMRAGAGTTGEAETYMRNWFSHMSAKSTQDHFQAVGIDFEKAKLKKVGDGKGQVSNIEASFMVMDDYIDKVISSGQVKTYDKKGKLKTSTDVRNELKAAFEQAKKDKLSGEAMENFVKSAVQRVGMSSIFQDMQVTQAYLAWQSGKEKFRDIRKDLRDPSVGQTIATDEKQQNSLSTQKWEALKTSLADLAITVGQRLQPAVDKILDGLTSAATAISDWAKKNETLATVVITVVAGIAALSAAVIALGVAAAGARLGLATARGLPVIGRMFGGPSAGAVTAARAAAAATAAPAAAGAGAGAAAGAGAKAVAGASRLASAGRLFARVATPLAVGAAVLDAGTALADDKLSRVQKAGAVAAAGGSLAGGLAGAKLGALVGTAIFPGVGTVIGGAIGGVGGALAGQWLGKKAVDVATGGKPAVPVAPATATPATAAPKAPTAAATPAAAAAASSAAAKAASTGAQAAPPPINVTVDYKPQVTIQGDPIPGQAEKFAALLRENAQVVADLVNRAVAEKARVSFK